MIAEKPNVSAVLPVLGFCFSVAMEQTAVNAGGRLVAVCVFR